MTEYTTSSEAIREYLSARERTAYWVNSHHTRIPEDELLSPSAPPSELEDSDAPSYGPSDSDDESTHSLPPRMVLRWNDGRPDLPISTDPQHLYARAQSARPSDERRRNVPLGHGSHGPPPPSIPRHGTAGPFPRYEQSLSYATAPGGEEPLEGPENIVVLPSPQEGDQSQAPMSVGGVPSHVSHLESRPMPSRAPTMSSARRSQMDPSFDPSGAYQSSVNRHHSIAAPRPRRAYGSSLGSRHGAHSPSSAYPQSQPMQSSRDGRFREDLPGPRAASQLPYSYSPPAIVYAPSSRHGSRYAPPPIVYSPPSHSNYSHTRGAPSITYSHSAPLPHGHRPGTRGSYHPSHQGAPSNLPLDEEAELRNSASGRSRSRVRAMSESIPRHGSNSERSRTRGMYAVPRSPYRPESRPRSPFREEGGSDTSGSTYYILPTPGQKVQIIVSFTTLGVDLISLTCKSASWHPVSLYLHFHYQKRTTVAVLAALSFKSEEAFFPAHI